MKPSIIIDIHEKRTKVFKYIENSSEINHEIKSLYIGDYIAGGAVIERKTTSDFLTSLASGRLRNQIRKLQETEKRLLILEGPLGQLEGLDKRRVYGAIVSLILHNNIKLITTESAWETYQILTILAKQKMRTNKTALDAATKKLPIPKEMLRKNVVSNIYGIGPKTAQKLLERFGSIQNIVNANESDLKEVIGVRIKQFLEIVRE